MSSSDDFAYDPVQIYLREVGAVPPLTQDEEIELSRRVLAHDERSEPARIRLMEAHLAMVVSIAQRYANRGVDVLDLIQTGNTALLLALKKFEEDPKTSFAVHAAACAEAAIASAIAAS